MTLPGYSIPPTCNAGRRRNSAPIHDRPRRCARRRALRSLPGAITIPSDGVVAGDGPSAEVTKTEEAEPHVSSNIGLSLVEKIQLRMDRREGCRKQTEAQSLDVVDRIKFVQQCFQQ